jgi:hypothetical protein
MLFKGFNHFDLRQKKNPFEWALYMKLSFILFYILCSMYIVIASYCHATLVDDCSCLKCGCVCAIKPSPKILNTQRHYS